MQPELGPVQQPFLSWVLHALGTWYAILLPVSALVAFALTLIVVIRGKGPMAGVALMLIIPIPFLIGVFAAIEGGVESYNLMATQGANPDAGRGAEVMATLLVAPMVGMSLMAPSYILAALGSLIRSLSAVAKVANEGRE